jgi:hypothetical protein
VTQPCALEHPKNYLQLPTATAKHRGLFIVAVVRRREGEALDYNELIAMALIQIQILN